EAPQSRLVDSTDTLPASWPGKATSSAFSRPARTSKTGRARTGLPGAPVPPAVKLFERELRKKYSLSRPMVWHLSNQKPKIKRPPERAWWSRFEPPNNTVVPGCPKMPPEPGGLVVTSGGSRLSLIHQSKYSALTQKCPAGPQITQPQSSPGAQS